MISHKLLMRVLFGFNLFFSRLSDLFRFGALGLLLGLLFFCGPSRLFRRRLDRESEF